MVEELSTSKQRNRDQTIQLNRSGRSFLKSFFAAFRMLQFHDIENRIFDEPIEQLLKASNEIFTSEGSIVFQILDDQFFLNRLWIKPTIGERETLYSLVDIFKQKKIGGITFRSNTTPENIKKVFSILKTNPNENENPAAQFNQALIESRIEDIELHPLVPQNPDIQMNLPLSPMIYSSVIGYAKMILALKEFIRSAPGDEQIAALRKAQRMICELIDVSDKQPRLFALLSLLKNFDSYFVHHSANVFILSVLLGKHMGMGRKDMVDLGMAALFFDVGKMAIPASVLLKVSNLTPEERQLIEQHPLETASTFLRLGYINESVIERALVGFQHHWATRSPQAYPQTRRKMVPSFMSNVVAICDRYDALISDKVYRLGITPRQALRLMATENKQGWYNTPIFHEFLRFMGPLPLGSWIMWEDKKQEALVIASGGLSPDPLLPLLYQPNESENQKWFTPEQGTTIRIGLHLKPIRADRTIYTQSIKEVFQTADKSPLLIQ